MSMLERRYVITLLRTEVLCSLTLVSIRSRLANISIIRVHMYDIHVEVH